jgi:hypothetical protein
MRDNIYEIASICDQSEANIAMNEEIKREEKWVTIPSRNDGIDWVS